MAIHSSILAGRISWTVARQAPLSMEFSRQEYWSGLPFPSPGDLPGPGWLTIYACVCFWAILLQQIYVSVCQHYWRRRWHPRQGSCPGNPRDGGAWRAAVHGVAEGRTRLSDFTFAFHFHALEKERATHSSVLAWRIPGTGEPGGLPSMGSHRVGHD